MVAHGRAHNEDLWIKGIFLEEMTWKMSKSWPHREAACWGGEWGVTLEPPARGSPG